MTDWIKLRVRRLGVKLTREYARPRRNIHAVIHEENAWYEKRMEELEEKDYGDGNLCT